MSNCQSSFFLDLFLALEMTSYDLALSLLAPLKVRVWFVVVVNKVELLDETVKHKEREVGWVLSWKKVNKMMSQPLHLTDY